MQSRHELGAQILIDSSVWTKLVKAVFTFSVISANCWFEKVAMWFCVAIQARSRYMLTFSWAGVGMSTQLILQLFNLLNTLVSTRPKIQISWRFDGIDGGTLCVCVCFRCWLTSVATVAGKQLKVTWRDLLKQRTWWEVWGSEGTCWEDKAFLGG